MWRGREKAKSDEERMTPWLALCARMCAEQVDVPPLCALCLHEVERGKGRYFIVDDDKGHIPALRRRYVTK